jgi:hypothetical protein
LSSESSDNRFCLNQSLIALSIPAVRDGPPASNHRSPLTSRRYRR